MKNIPDMNIDKQQEHEISTFQFIYPIQLNTPSVSSQLSFEGYLDIPINFAAFETTNKQKRNFYTKATSKK